MDQQEEWKQYEDTVYMVSNLGRVKRTYKNGRTSFVRGTITRQGYIKMELVRRPTRIDKLIHTMVAECFIDNPENKPIVDHINQVKSDNRACNLRWVTYSENQQNITPLRANNSSGCVGIHSRQVKGEHVSWVVRISLNNKRIHIGDFKEFDDAVKARREAEKKYFGEYNAERE